MTPGEYLALAFEDADPGLISDPAFRARFSSSAAKVTLGEGAHGNLDLKPIPREVSDAEAAKIP